MARVKVIVNQTLVLDGMGYGPGSGWFEMSDELANELGQRGLIEIEREKGLRIGAPPVELPDPVFEIPAMSEPEPLGVDVLPSATGSILASLQYAGYSTVEEIAAASEEDLVALPKIGVAKARRLKNEADELLG